MKVVAPAKGLAKLRTRATGYSSINQNNITKTAALLEITKGYAAYEDTKV